MRKAPRARRAPGKSDEWDPVNRWQEKNGGSVPEKKVFIFGEDGKNVAVKDVECGATYYTMYHERALVPNCPSLLALRTLRLKAQQFAMAAARRVRDRCAHSGCNGSITLQLKIARCSQFGGGFKPIGHDIHAGYVYRIDCIAI